MLLVIDVGNTNIVLGIFKGKELMDHWRVSTNRLRTTDEYGVLIRNLFYLNGVNSDEIDAIIISSVVPPVMPTLERMCQRYFGLTPLIIGPGVKTGMDIKYDNPREVGADRMSTPLQRMKNSAARSSSSTSARRRPSVPSTRKGITSAAPSARASASLQTPWSSARRNCRVSKSSARIRSSAAIPSKVCRPVSSMASSAKSTASSPVCARN